MTRATDHDEPRIILIRDNGNRVRFQYEDASETESKAEAQDPLYLKKQLWKLGWEQAPGIACTCIILVLYIGVLVGYEARPVTHRGKVTYNTLSTAVLIALGLSFFGVLKSIAKVLRWRLLFGRSLEPLKADLILGADSLGNTFLLMCRSWSRRPAIAAIAAIAAGWIFLNIAAQVTVAMIQLNASMDNGYNSDTITSSPGTVMVPKLDCFYKLNNETCPAIDSPIQPPIAHSYGESIDIQLEQDCMYIGDAQDITGRQDCNYFAQVNGTVPEFAVRFADYNPVDITDRVYPFLDTGRFLTVNATNCRSYNATYQTEMGPAGLEYQLAFPNGPDGTVNISITRGDLAADSTEYIWKGSRLPGNETGTSNETCGERCVYLYSVRDFWDGPNHNVTTYQCEIRVSDVSNVTDELHMVPSNVARTAAAAIALTGQPREGNADLTIPPSAVPTTNWDQFHSYPAGADWAAMRNESASDVGRRMARFAAAALGTLAERNPVSEAQGMVPELGNTLEVKWSYVIPLACCIAAAHVLLVFLMLFLVRRTIVPDDSALVLGRVLKAVV